MKNRRPLVELDPRWVVEGDNYCTAEEAVGLKVWGIFFSCPACADPDGYSHAISVPFAECPPERNWNVDKKTWGHGRQGYDFGSLTVSPSIDCSKSGSCSFHGRIQDGVVTW